MVQDTGAQYGLHQSHFKDEELTCARLGAYELGQIAIKSMCQQLDSLTFGPGHFLPRSMSISWVGSNLNIKTTKDFKGRISYFGKVGDLLRLTKQIEAIDKDLRKHIDRHDMVKQGDGHAVLGRKVVRTFRPERLWKIPTGTV